mgnify:FL=1
MNKKLLTAAVGAALFAAGSLASHAATSLYGHMHLSWDKLDNGSTVESSRISANSTRIGVKGDEDLGGGLKAIWQIESGALGIDEATNGFGGDLRNSFVGFSNSGWGTVKIGRHDTPFKDLGRRLDNFNEQVGDARNLFGLGLYDLRAKNMVRYESPTFGGLNFSALHSTNNGEDNPGNASQPVTSLGANWTAGPLFIGGAYETHGTGLGVAPGTEDKEKGIRLATSYAMGDFVLGLMYEMLNDVAGASDVDQNTYGLFASFKMGNNKLKAHWINSDDLDCPSTLVCSETGATMLAIGVDHAMSKTVTTYVNYAKVDNDANAGLGVVSGNGGHGETVTVPAGRDPDGISVGVIMKF